ncbi:DNA cytosine methyltransferase [Breznakia sp. OttesenSCG-928-G09]|nr:DNA cytosine methyltransferase [Breznakia sp. OttesenSCG-928-G09]
MDQTNLFEFLRDPYQIDKPIRLIELFAGYGSQAMALKRLGANFEHYKVVEFDKYAIKSYNAVHGTDYSTIDITKVKATDLEINDTDKYCYIMTYSFPCQDLSKAGKGKGMSKGSNTLNTMQGGNREPKIAYPLGSREFKATGFKDISPTICARDYKDPKVVAEPLICASRGRNPNNPKSIKSGEETVQMIEINDSGCSNTLTTVQKDNMVFQSANGVSVNQRGNYQQGPLKDLARTIRASNHDAGVVIGSTQKNAYKGSVDDPAPSLTSSMGTGGDHTPMIAKKENPNNPQSYMIRKLTPRECGRLMGVSDEDITKMMQVNSNSQLYKQFGNSIVVDVLVAIFGKMIKE